MTNVCQACRTCVHTCPANALFNRDWKPGEIVEKVTHRKDACIYCGACAQACPVRAIVVRKTAILPEMKGKNSLREDARPASSLADSDVTPRDGRRGVPGLRKLRHRMPGQRAVRSIPGGGPPQRAGLEAALGGEERDSQGCGPGGLRLMRYLQHDLPCGCDMARAAGGVLEWLRLLSRTVTSSIPSMR